uniref:Uncharacterized protein n=1 Tax=Corvus moneduloides TaxID=1196302 RepID=A0A8U7NAR1_CORMO
MHLGLSGKDVENRNNSSLLLYSYMCITSQTNNNNYGSNSKTITNPVPAFLAVRPFPLRCGSGHSQALRFLHFVFWYLLCFMLCRQHVNY